MSTVSLYPPPPQYSTHPTYFQQSGHTGAFEFQQFRLAVAMGMIGAHWLRLAQVKKALAPCNLFALDAERRANSSAYMSWLNTMTFSGKKEKPLLDIALIPRGGYTAKTPSAIATGTHRSSAVRARIQIRAQIYLKNQLRGGTIGRGWLCRPQ